MDIKNNCQIDYTTVVAKYNIFKEYFETLFIGLEEAIITIHVS